MPLIDIRPTRSPRRRMNMFYLIDTSGSMNSNGCIQSVNAAIPEIIGILRQVSYSNKDLCDIYMSCIAFGDKARLLHNVPVLAEDFPWEDLEASGYTNLEAAFNLLDSQLNGDSVLNSREGHLRPAVILLTDGDPDEGWENGLRRLRKNPWFREAYKIAIAIGADASKAVMKKALVDFTESKPGETAGIVSVTQLDRLSEIIRIVSTSVSTIGSRSAETGRQGSVRKQISESIKKEVDPIDGVEIPVISGDSSFWD